MLIVISGVSGVGKSLVCQQLVARYDWRFITTYTTRPARVRESEKITLSATEFTLKECLGQFYCADIFYGHRYGLMRADISRAFVDLTHFWMIDRPIWKMDTFKDIPHLNAILLPTHQGQLTEQLNRAGRNERLKEVLLDYATNYSPFHSERPKAANAVVVVNEPGCGGSAADAIASWCRSWLAEDGNE